MIYVAFVFAIFGFIAYVELSSLKKRVTDLERQLSNVSGTTYAEDRASLARAVQTYLGKSVSIDLKEDHQDADIAMYGNSKHGRNTILDADGEWLLVCTESAKGRKEKLIRLESVQNIRLDETE